MISMLWLSMIAVSDCYYANAIMFRNIVHKSFDVRHLEEMDYTAHIHTP